MEDDEASPANSYSNSQNSNNVVEDEEQEEEETSIYEVISKGSSRYDSENSYDDRPSKRMKPFEEDRLSKLPEPIITHILSFLPAIDAVKTQLISKRFRHLWASMTTLLFPAIRVSDDFYAQFISNVLMLHRGPLIKKLYLSEIRLSSDDVKPPYNLWVQAAVIKQVEELVVKIYCSIRWFLFPNSLLLCDTLREFSLSVSNIELGSRICWKSLTKLTLKRIVNLSDDMIRKIVVGSPALESLSLIKCRGFSRVIIDSSSSNLRNLVVNCAYSFYPSDDDEEDDDQINDYLEISAPKITSLEISGYMGDKHCRLKEVSSLVRLVLRFIMSTIDGHIWDQHVKSIDEASRAKLQKCESTLLDLLRKTSHVEKLSIGNWCTQILSMCELRRRPATFLKCKSLEVDGFHDKSLPGIARLIYRSFHLETLILNLDFPYHDRDEVELFYEVSDFSSKNYWESNKKLFKNAMQCLKIVEINGCKEASLSLMVELAEFVLQHAKSLEKLVCKIDDKAYNFFRYHADFKNSCVFEFIQKLLSCPRSSPQARVLFL